MLSTVLKLPLDTQKGIRGSQYLSICYTERLARVNIAASVGSTGDSYDNAMAETINGLYKTEVNGIAVLGVVSKKQNLLHWSGWIGSTIEDCWTQSDTSHRQNLKRRIIANRKSQLMQLDSRKHVSRKTGAIRFSLCQALHPILCLQETLVGRFPGRKRLFPEGVLDFV